MNPSRLVAFAAVLFVAFALNALAAAPLRAAAPTIVSFTPGSGKLTAPVTITGTNFTAPATVKFGGVAATEVAVSSSTKIVASVPGTAATGKITVTTAGGTGTSAASFGIVPGLVSSNAVGQPDAARTLSYSGFAAYEAVDLYFDTDDLALGSASGAGAGASPVTVPAAAMPGLHWFTAVGRKSGESAQIGFTVRTDALQFGFRPTHQDYNAVENVVSTSTVDDLQEAWRTPPIGTTYGTPAVVAGTVYDGFTDGTVRAFAESNGAQKWSCDLGSAVYSSPAFAAGVIYIGDDGGHFNAINAATGALQWRYATGNAVRSSPTVVGGKVYIGSFDSKVYAVNAASGALVWSFTAGGAIFSSPAVAGGMVYVGCNDESVYALNAATGAQIWKFTTGGAVDASPVVVNGTVYIGSQDANMYALRATTGIIEWTYTAGGGIEATAAVASGTLYFSADDGKVYALTAANGTLRWSAASPGGLPLAQGCCVANGVLYVGDAGRTYALAASYGGLLAVFPVSTQYGSATVVNGAVTIPDYADGVLGHYTLDAAQMPAAPGRPEPSSLHPRALR